MLKETKSDQCYCSSIYNNNKLSSYTHSLLAIAILSMTV